MVYDSKTNECLDHVKRAICRLCPEEKVFVLEELIEALTDMSTELSNEIKTETIPNYMPLFDD